MNTIIKANMDRFWAKLTVQPALECLLGGNSRSSLGLK